VRYVDGTIHEEGSRWNRGTEAAMKCCTRVRVIGTRAYEKGKEERSYSQSSVMRESGIGRNGDDEAEVEK
jgi:hypothetical protein